MVLSPFCRRFAIFIGAVDVPTDQRRMHRVPIPRCGGIAVFISFLLIGAVGFSNNSRGMIVGGTIIFALGIADDVFRLSPATKLIFQSLAAVSSLALSDDIFLTDSPSLLRFFLAFLFIVTMTNALNLIDGLDGLCAGVSAAAGIFLFIISENVYPLILSGALIGFLPFNLHPAKMFLGDAGAMLSGYLLSIFTLSCLSRADSPRYLTSFAIILALPLTDTLFSFIRRILSGRSPFSPDRSHIHHLIVDSGISHPAASFLLVLFSVSLGTLGSVTLYYPFFPLPLICLCLILSAALCILSIVKKAF